MRDHTRHFLTLPQIVGQRIGGKVAIVAVGEAATSLWRVDEGEEVAPFLQALLWGDQGAFYATGYVIVSDAWKVERWPTDEEARSIEKVTGRAVQARYSRTDVRPPFGWAPPDLVFG